jgi:hypothetical protein
VTTRGVLHPEAIGCVHLVFEAGGAAVHGISRSRFERRLEGAGWAVGTKFLPAGIAPFSQLAVRELTDRGGRRRHA